MVRILEVGHMAELVCCDGYGCCAASAATGYELKFPIEHGIVTNWTDMKNITPEEHLDEPRSHDADHVRDVLRARHVRSDPDRLVLVRLETHEGRCDDPWLQPFPHSTHLRSLCSASRHPSGWP